MEKAAASASISEAAQEVYLLCVEAVVVSSNRPTVVVAVNNEVESKSQRFCERCSRPTVRIFFCKLWRGIYSRSSTAHGNKIAYIMVVHWWRTSHSKAYCVQRSALALQEQIGLHNFCKNILVVFILILEQLEQLLHNELKRGKMSILVGQYTVCTMTQSISAQCAEMRKKFQFQMCVWVVA